MWEMVVQASISQVSGFDLDSLGFKVFTYLTVLHEPLTIWVKWPATTGKIAPTMVPPDQERQELT